MTREEIKNTPELVDFMLDESIIADSREKLRKRLEKVCNLAIKALEQEPCENCVSRADALKVINKMNIPEDMSVFEIKSHIGVEIGTLPPVTPQPKTEHWIPCSERLPKTAGVYRVTRYYQDKKNPHYLVDACYFDGSDTWHNDNRINHERVYVYNIVAWQENPEPYKPQEIDVFPADHIKVADKCRVCDYAKKRKCMGTGVFCFKEKEKELDDRKFPRELEDYLDHASRDCITNVYPKDWRDSK